MASFKQYDTKQGKRWEYRLKYKCPISGETKEKSQKKYLTKKEAQLAAAKFEQDFRDGYLEENTSLTDYIMYWLDSHKKENIRESTYENKLQQIRLHIIPYFQNIKLQDMAFKPEFYQGFIDQMAANDYSKSTIANSHWILNAVFEKAIETGKLKKNPAASATLKGKAKAKKDEFEFIARQDVDVLLEQARKEGLTYYMLFRTLFETGFRKGEACGLTWDDIDFENGTISITKAMDTQKLKFTETKTKSSIRKIAAKRLMPELKKLRKWQLENKLAWGEQYDVQKMNLVFCREKGEPLPKSTLFNVFRRMQQKTNVIAGTNDKGKPVYFSIHATRHTHTSLCVEAGMLPKAIQKRLGHGSYEVTMNIYAHISKQFEADSADLYEQATEAIFQKLDEERNNNFDMIRGI